MRRAVVCKGWGRHPSTSASPHTWQTKHRLQPKAQKRSYCWEICYPTVGANAHCPNTHPAGNSYPGKVKTPDDRQALTHTFRTKPEIALDTIMATRPCFSSDWRVELVSGPPQSLLSPGTLQGSRRPKLPEPSLGGAKSRPRGGKVRRVQSTGLCGGWPPTRRVCVVPRALQHKTNHV